MATAPESSGEPRRHRRRGLEDELLVTPPFGLAAVERRPLPDRDERILEPGAPRVMRMNVARGNSADTEIAGELAQPCIPPGIAAQVRPLELDEEALPSERAAEPCRAVRIAYCQPMARTPREADKTFVALLEASEVDGGVEPLVSMALCEKPAQVCVARRGLDQERDMSAAGQSHLRPCDRPHAERLRRVRELERAIDAVVVGQGERRVVELAARTASSSGSEAPSRNEYAEWQWSSTYLMSLAARRSRPAEPGSATG